MRWQLADSFDILPNGTCAGRGFNHGMTDGARVQLSGSTTGFVDEATATASLEYRDLTAGEARGDDGLYCVLLAVFSPSMPDPDGYSVKFPGTRVRTDHLKAGNGTPFGQPDNLPGYGVLSIGSQTCPTLLDPPDKEC